MRLGNVGVWTMSASAVLALAAASGCGGVDPASSPAASPEGAVASSEDPQGEADVGEEAVEAYELFWVAVAEAGEIPDPQHPDLARYGAEDALDDVTALLIGYRETGRATSGRPQTNPEVVDSDDASSSVEISDCGDSTDWVTYDVDSGAEVGEPGGRQQIVAVVEVVDDDWKVTAFGIDEVGSC